MNKIKTTTDIVYNNNTKKNITIVHISDIHFNKNTKYKNLEKIINYIYKLKPDYIMITGDTIDVPKITKDKKKINELVLFLTKLAEIAKVLISLGNHDVIIDEDYNFFNKLDDLYNIYILNNTSYHDEFIYVLGITLPNCYYYNIMGGESTEALIEQLDSLKMKIAKMPKNLPKIALIHSPIKLTENGVIDRLKNFDLVLCGHTHNGMVPDILNFLFKGNVGIISPRKGLFPKIAKGKIEREIGNNKVTIIINGAITKLSQQSGKILSKLNFVYNKSVNKIIIRKKRGIKYE